MDREKDIRNNSPHHLPLQHMYERVAAEVKHKIQIRMLKIFFLHE
jgi:hypothetical protein